MQESWGCDSLRYGHRHGCPTTVWLPRLQLEERWQQWKMHVYLYLYLACRAEAWSAVVSGSHGEGILCSLHPSQGGSGSQLPGGRIQGETLRSGSCRRRNKYRHQIKYSKLHGYATVNVFKIYKILTWQRVVHSPIFSLVGIFSGHCPEDCPRWKTLHNLQQKGIVFQPFYCIHIIYFYHHTRPCLCFPSNTIIPRHYLIRLMQTPKP